MKFEVFLLYQVFFGNVLLYLLLYGIVLHVTFQADELEQIIL